MAKVKGPLFSLSASGTYNELVTFRQQPRLAQAFQQKPSTQTRTTAQNDHNAAVASMASTWSALSGSTKSSWAACGATFNMSGFNLWWREWFLQGSTPITPPTKPCP